MTEKHNDISVTIQEFKIIANKTTYEMKELNNAIIKFGALVAKELNRFYKKVDEIVNTAKE